jgi:hypothetical protein
MVDPTLSCFVTVLQHGNWTSETPAANRFIAFIPSSPVHMGDMRCAPLLKIVGDLRINCARLSMQALSNGDQSW